MAEKFDIKKAVDLSPTAIGKSVSIGAKFCLVFFALFCIYFTGKNLFFPKPTQNIKVESGGQVTIRNEARKKSLIPFIEVYADQRTGFNTLGTGIRAGIRFEW